MRLGQKANSQMFKNQGKQNSIAHRMDDNMVPMINVVFLMLIFFMVAGQIKKTDPIHVVPPTSINEAQSKKEPSVVLMVNNEQLFADNQPIRIEELTAYLSVKFDLHKSTQTTQKRMESEHFFIQIKADGQLTVDKLKPIFAQIKAAGLTKVSLATQLAHHPMDTGSPSIESPIVRSPTVGSSQ